MGDRVKIGQSAYRGDILLGNALPLVVFAGPCQIESRDHALRHARQLAAVCDELHMSLVYKSSYDKANRSRVRSVRGLGMQEGLRILEEVKRETGCAVMTDVHEIYQVAPTAEVVQVLQIPALLSRQTDLIVAAAKTGRVVNLKKGQFMAPMDAKWMGEKMEKAGNPAYFFTERGSSFGHGDLVVDFRGIPIMGLSAPVVFDATHSVQRPGGTAGVSGGERGFVPVLSRAAVAAKVAGIFIECHEKPDEAPSDGPCMMPLGLMHGLLKSLRDIDELVKGLNE